MITVVTPTITGREHFLKEAVESVKAQTLQPAAHLIELDEHYEGPAPTMNKMLARVDTEWVAILADDDLYDPDHLETLYNASEGADVVMSWGRIVGKDVPQYRGEFHPRGFLDRADTGMRGCFMFRKSLADVLGGWPENTAAEDWCFLCGCVNYGATFVGIHRETWTYRWHGGNCSDVYQAVMDGKRPKQMYHLARYA